ncbi:MAG: Xaa-Pro peptidase family protein [Archaeoglobaceae archaeon]|nr:Xaa-Pro peptidase family protein [Archaeoglobaceae archaeon]MCX8151652.1 Xaa-Pro peptidase family protein [Archaeoglobaceae archaeon]MDW8013070.1 Xaa-Pro peptidase family protein [Archaeoglobaceae archaeon]
MRCFILYASSKDANFYYMTRFKTTDPCIYLLCEDKTELLIVPKMELRRAERESKVKELASFEDLGYKEFIKKLDPKEAVLQVLIRILNECKVKEVVVPENFPAYYAFKLSENFKIVFDNPVKKRRVIKSISEINEIEKVARKILETFDWLLKNFKFNRCEEVRRTVEMKLYEMGCLAEGTIASSGKISSDPHEIGRGKIEDHLVLDIFPKSLESLYYADFTRTIFLNKNLELEEMFDAVLDAQSEALSMIKDGVNARDVHEMVKCKLEERGFKTDKGEGFIHSTGHGVGLEIHEEPRISEQNYTLRSGMVVTVEPGLYYREVGGVRVEDLIVITKDGCKILTDYEKKIKLF